MAAYDVNDVANIRRAVATVRTLLEALDQLTGNEAEHVGQQLAEELASLGRRLLDAATGIARLHGPVSGIYFESTPPHR